MRDKFGLEFRIVDTELLRQLRRSRGLARQPVDALPAADRRRSTGSSATVRMRLLREVLPPRARATRARFDLLIVDEVHTCAPSGRGQYAVDSQRTTAIRTLAPHCEHRLFLSATPHNGYRKSFTALLELLDPQRFARGVRPARGAAQAGDGAPAEVGAADAVGRHAALPAAASVATLEVDYPDDERAGARELSAYARSRRAGRGEWPAGRTAADFVTTLLKKRLFSSPAAFAETLDVHLATLSAERTAASAAPKSLPALFDRARRGRRGRRRRRARADRVGRSGRPAHGAARRPAR